MSKITDTTDYLVLILTAIRENRTTAKELLELSPEGREEYKQKLIAEEKTEIERGNKLLEESAK
jgi:hypothetical protein